MPSKRTLFNELMAAAQANAPGFSKLVASTLKEHQLLAPKKPVKEPYARVHVPLGVRQERAGQ